MTYVKFFSYKRVEVEHVKCRWTCRELGNQKHSHILRNRFLSEPKFGIKYPTNADSVPYFISCSIPIRSVIRILVQLEKCYSKILWLLLQVFSLGKYEYSSFGLLIFTRNNLSIPYHFKIFGKLLKMMLQWVTCL